MNPPQGIAQTQAEALIRRLTREQESRRRRVIDGAHEHASEIVSRARQEARERLREAVAEERRSIERAVTARLAEIESSALQKEQFAVRDVLDHAWESLRHALGARWEQSESRKSWCRAACSLARDAVLSDASLVIEFDPDLAAETDEFAASCLAQDGSRQVKTQACPGIGPGLRIRAGRACLDATVDGLLADRENIEAELLAEFDRQTPANQEDFR